MTDLRQKPKPIAYCQACQDFITDDQAVSRCGSLLYHFGCAPVRQDRPLVNSAAPAPAWRKMLGISAVIAIGSLAVMGSGIFLLILFLACPLLFFFLLWLPFAFAAQASRRAFIRNVAKEAARDGAREFVSELAKYRR